MLCDAKRGSFGDGKAEWTSVLGPIEKPKTPFVAVKPVAERTHPSTFGRSKRVQLCNDEGGPGPFDYDPQVAGALVPHDPRFAGPTPAPIRNLVEPAKRVDFDRSVSDTKRVAEAQKQFAVYDQRVSFEDRVKVDFKMLYNQSFRVRSAGCPERPNFPNADWPRPVTQETQDNISAAAKAGDHAAVDELVAQAARPKIKLVACSPGFPNGTERATSSRLGRAARFSRTIEEDITGPARYSCEPVFGEKEPQFNPNPAHASFTFGHQKRQDLLEFLNLDVTPGPGAYEGRIEMHTAPPETKAREPVDPSTEKKLQEAFRLGKTPLNQHKNIMPAAFGSTMRFTYPIPGTGTAKGKDVGDDVAQRASGTPALRVGKDLSKARREASLVRTVKSTFGKAARKDFLDSLRDQGLTEGATDTPGPGSYDPSSSTLETEERAFMDLVQGGGVESPPTAGAKRKGQGQGKGKGKVDHGALIAKSPKRAPTPSKNSRLGYATSIPGGKGLCSVEIGRLVKLSESDSTFTSRSKKIITAGIYDPLPTSKLSGKKLKEFEEKYNQLSKDLVGLVEELSSTREESEATLPLPASNELHKLFGSVNTPPAIPRSILRSNRFSGREGANEPAVPEPALIAELRARRMG